METRMGIEDSLKNSLGPCISASGSLAVSMYPAGEKGVTFMPSVSEEGIISWENDGGMINPDPINIHGVDITNIEQTVSSTENGGINEVTVTLSNGDTSKFEIKNGSKGDPATIRVGDVTIGDSTSVTNSGTEQDVILDFTFPGSGTNVTLNGTRNEKPNIYAPVSSGQEGDILISKGENKSPEWKKSLYEPIQYFSQGTLTTLISEEAFRQSLVDFKDKIIGGKRPLYELVCTSNKIVTNAPKTANYGYTINAVEENEELSNEDTKETHFYSAFFDNITSFNLTDTGFEYSMSAFIQNTNFFGVKCNNSIIDISVNYNEEKIKIDISISDNKYLPTSNNKNSFIDFENNGLVYTVTTDTNYTQTDVDRIKDIVFEGTEATKEDLEKYDLNNDGEIDAGDLALVFRYISKNFTKNTPLKIRIDEYGNLKFLDGLGNELVSIGLDISSFSSIESNEINANTLNVDGKTIDGGTVLYEGESNDTIQLKESSLSYEYFEIYFRNNDGQQGSIRFKGGDTPFPISLYTINSYGTYCWFKTKTVIMDEYEIRNDGTNHSEVMFDNDGTIVNNLNSIYILKVVGYKG